VLFEVALTAAMGLKRGKNVVWWCPSLTLRVSIARWKSPRRNYRNKRFGFLLLDGNRQGATIETNASGFDVAVETAKAQHRNGCFGA